MTAQTASTVDVLKAAREKIAKPEAWTKGTFARDTDGRPVGYSSPKAVCWCWLGAVASVAGTGDLDRATPLMRQVVGGSSQRFNDAPTTTHADVIAMFDKAIALAEGEV